MVIEATAFNVLGVKINKEHIDGIAAALNRSYNTLADRNPKWKDVEFCKREITSLWDAIVEMFTRPDLLFQEINSEELRKLLFVDSDNEAFLEVFGKNLEDMGVLQDILRQFAEIKMEKGSLLIFFKESDNRMRMAKIRIDKMVSKIKRESNNIKNALSQFVEFVKRNMRPILTCSLVSGIIVISLVAGIWIGISIEIVKLLIIAIIAIICWIVETCGTVSSINDLMKALSRRFGFVLY